jgi:hypothetical protein
MNRDLEKISHVWKATRLLLGLTQKELANQLGISQGSVSKYESMQLEPSASDWYNFCHFAGIDAHKTLELGYIDGKKRFKHRLYSEASFTLPMRYRGDFSLKVRELVCFRDAVLAELGGEFWGDFLKKVGVKAEMFFVYDYQISLNFLYDLIRHCENAGVTLWGLALHHTLREETHGVLGDEYLKRRRAQDLLESLVNNQPYYQRALDVEIDSWPDLTCTFRPSPEALEIFDERELRPFMDYKVSGLSALLRAHFPDVAIGPGPAVGSFRLEA